MSVQKVSTWDMIQEHPLAKDLPADAQLALLCEYVDLIDELEGMSLTEYIDGYFAGADQDVEARAAAMDRAEVDEDVEGSPAVDGDAEGAEKPRDMTGLRVVYKFPGRNVLADAAGVTRDRGGTVSFTDVDGEAWSNVSREKVHVIKPTDRIEIRVSAREAREFDGWLGAPADGDKPARPGKAAKGHADGEVLRNLAYEFPNHPDKIMLVIMNGKKPYVDRFVQKPDGGFEDDQKPTTRLFGEHCFRVRGVDYICEVLTP